MDNPFFKNNGPFTLKEILKQLNLPFDNKYEDFIINDIKDLQNSNLNQITFFHSKKYKIVANNTKASFCITTNILKNELPKKCIPIIVDNVLVSNSIITSKFYPYSINDNFNIAVNDINKNEFNYKVNFGKYVLIGQNI